MGDSAARKLKARAEIENREWIEVELELGDGNTIKDLKWHAWGCARLLTAAGELSKMLNQAKIDEVKYQNGSGHWDLLVNEVIAKLQGKFQPPITEDELCHCRKVPTRKVDEAVVLGAHTPEKVRAWTTASSGCGTCRPEVEKIIQFRLRKK